MALDEYLRGEDERQLLQKKMQQEGRLPPGQAATIKWPVLHTGDVPEFDPQTWDFRVGGLVSAPLDLGWDAFLSLPQTAVVSDFHCVTKWSTFDNRWEGVPFREILKRVHPKPEAKYVMALGHVGPARYGYSTNIPLLDLDREDVLLAHRHDGRELPPDHGGPLRLVVPHLYAWKSEMAARPDLHGRGQGRLLGAARLSHVRRSVPRAEVLRRVTPPSTAP